MLISTIVLLGGMAGCLEGADDASNSDTIRIAFEVKDDYTDADANPQLFAEYMRKETGLDVEIYPVSSEGSIIEALRFGHADIAFMDAGAAWMG